MWSYESVTLELIYCSNFPPATSLLLCRVFLVPPPPLRHTFHAKMGFLSLLFCDYGPHLLHIKTRSLSRILAVDLIVKEHYYGCDHVFNKMLY